MKVLKIYGPPGTGKTTRLLQLMEHELEGLPPYRLTFLTFTRSARREALERARRTEEEFKFCRTLHAICWRQLGMSRDRMVTPRALREWGRQIGQELTGYDPDPFREDAYGDASQATVGDQMIRLNHLGRHRGVHLKEMLVDAPPEITWELAGWFTKAYRAWKDQEGLLDFTDLLTEYLKRGQPLPVRVGFVDEAQDLSRLQWAVMSKLTANADQLYVAGDDDQAIFTWAGASAEELNRFPADEVEVLRQSHRLPRAVHALALEVVQRINPANRQAKVVEPRDEEGEVRQAGWLTLGDLNAASTFVLYRHHHRGRQLARELELLGVPYHGHGSPLSEETTARALTALRHWSTGEAAPADLANAVIHQVDPADLLVREATRPMKMGEVVRHLPNRDQLAEWLEDGLPALEKASYVRRCLELAGWEETLRPRVRLQSIHQAKGQEADVVVLDTDLSRKAWEALQAAPDDEHRVWYVGATRARETLVVLSPSSALRYEL